MRNRENKNYRFVSFRFYQTRTRKFQKNLKNLKIPLWIHFKPKLIGEGWERGKIKIIVPLRSYPTRNRKFPKNSKIIQKIKKYHYGFISSQTRLEIDENEGNKNYRSVPFLPDV